MPISKKKFRRCKHRAARFKIPEGSYCYNILSVDYSNGCISTRLCPHWYKVSKYVGGCKFLKQVDRGVGLLWDQVKMCEVNCGDY